MEELLRVRALERRFGGRSALTGLAAPPPLPALTALPEVASAQALGAGAFRVTLRPGAAVAGLARRLVEADWGLAGLTPDRTDPEPVFFDILGRGQAA